MRIAILFPPLKKKYATYGQNRQFQYFKEPFFAYPLIAARLATMLENQGHSVEWIDCIAENYEILPGLSKYDKIYIEIKYPIAQEIYNMKIPNAIYYGDIENDPINYNNLPFEINRDLTKWWLYAYQNGNFRRTPGTYIQAADGCWYNKCTFCNWGNKSRKYRIREPQEVRQEIDGLYYKYGIKEFMDDSDTFPIGDWLREFCQEMEFIGLNKLVTLNCNMRFGVLQPKDFKLMKKAGFRMLLFGVESFDPFTLLKINKGITINNIVEDCVMATQAGLEPHLTLMFGYPWESKRDALETVKLANWLLKKGYASSIQATLIIPYPNTSLYKEAKEKDWLLTDDLSQYDMTIPVFKCDYNPMEYIQKIYKIVYHPWFLWHKIKKIRSMDDIKFYWRSFKKVKGHLYENRNRRAW